MRWPSDLQTRPEFTCGVGDLRVDTGCLSSANNEDLAAFRDADAGAAVLLGHMLHFAIVADRSLHFRVTAQCGPLHLDILLYS